MSGRRCRCVGWRVGEGEGEGVGRWGELGVKRKHLWKGGCRQSNWSGLFLVLGSAVPVLTVLK